MKKLFSHPHSIPWVFFIVFTSIYFISIVGIMNSLNASQYALTQALVEEHTIKINDYTKWVYLDYAEYNGDKYSFRAPGESILAVPFYFLAEQLAPFAASPYNGNHPGIDADSKLEALTSMYNAVFGALTVVLVYCISQLLTRSKRISAVVALSVGLGTLLWRYSAGFSRFSITSFFLLTLVYLLYLPHKQTRHYMFFGGAAGYLILLDPSLALIVGILSITFFITSLWKKKRLLFRIFLTGVAMSVPLIIFLIYNFAAFGNPLSSSYSHGPAGRVYNDLKNYYLIPLYPSVAVNLFSNSPIPRAVYPDNVWNNDVFQLQESVGWSTRNHYSGIITQSPYLIFAFIGCLILLKKKQWAAAGVFTAAVVWYIQMSKFSGFYAPTSYDTHYFLPTVLLLSLGLGPLIIYLHKKNIPLRFASYFAILIAVGVSCYNAWVSVVTNFGPHVTGEHRLDPGQLQQTDLPTLFTHTFPNIYNVPLLLVVYMPLFFCIYTLLFRGKNRHA